MTPQLFTPVQVQPLPFRLDFDSGIVTLGSCFADEVASRLADGGFRVEQNPFGTLYNPASVAAALERIIDCREITEEDLVQHNDLWHSWHHHGSFSRPTAGETLKACNSRLHQAHEALRSARLLMITFGTAWVYSLTPSPSPFGEGSGMQCVSTPLSFGRGGGGEAVVANCHKLPASMFTRRRMTVDEIVGLWKTLLQKLSAFNPRLSTLFTVSPIRHMADGAHGNQISKSTLLLAAEEICDVCCNNIATYATVCCNNIATYTTHYFPAYEIVLDELRDYRFYGPDMTHPSPLAVDIVYDRLQQACMTPAVIQQAHNNAKAARRLRHIPISQYRKPTDLA